MSTKDVEKLEASIATSCMLDVFRKDNAARTELLKMILIREGYLNYGDPKF